MTSSKLLKNGTVISFDPATGSLKVLLQASILILEDHIAAILQEEIPNIPPNTEILDCTNQILTPGFINTHIHSWQTAFRSLGANITLAQYFGWLSQASPQATASFSEKGDVYVSSLAGYLEGLNAGVTSFVEHGHCNWGEEVMREGFEAAVGCGARVWWCYDVRDGVEGFGVDEQVGVLEEMGQREGIGEEGALVEMGLALDGLVLGGWGWEKIEGVVREINAEVLTTHYLGGAWPATQTSPTAIGSSPLPALNKPVIISHSGFASASDRAALRAHNHHLSITPESEMHYGHCQVHGHLVLDQASLGVDTPFTFSGDILTQARIYLQHVRHQNHLDLLNKGLLAKDTAPMSVEDAFLLATRQGGKALWRDDIGVLTVGAKADIVVFDGESPNMLGSSDAVAAVVLHANVGDIEHVMVGGTWRKKDGKLVSMPGKEGWAEAKERFREVAGRIQPKNLVPPEMPEKLWGSGEFGEVEVSSIKKR